MSAPARECSSPMRLFPKSGSQSSSPLDSTVSLTVGLILGATLLDNCRHCLFKVQQTFVSALLTQCFKDKDSCKDKNKRHSRWFPLKFAPPKMRRGSNLPGGQCTSWQSSSPKSTAKETKRRRRRRTGMTITLPHQCLHNSPLYLQKLPPEECHHSSVTYLHDA